MTGSRDPHWVMNAVLGGAVALIAITMAHAALPDDLSAAPLRTAMLPAPPPIRLALTAAAEPDQPIVFSEPVPGHAVVSPFGLRQMPWEEHGRLHAGVDIAAQFGTPILAAADGVVAEVGESPSYGRYVLVQHTEGLASFYAHMGALAYGIAAGAPVSAGERLGEIGSTGRSTGPHLHFEIRNAQDRPLNPELFLGRSFAEARDLPLSAALTVSGAVRVALVSRFRPGRRPQAILRL
ncbi:MAG: M23 family metallopeptidase [Phenylobacterium sp.]